MNFEKAEVKELFDVLETKSEKSVDSYRRELSELRAGRANPRILDRVMVDYYGAPTPIQQVGNISVQDARTIAISVWDKTMVSAVEKGIIAANIGIHPSNDGNTTIRLCFPELTQEKRKEMAKGIKAMAEQNKVALRNLRRDANNKIKALKTSKVITEDETKEYEQLVDKTLNKFIDQVEKLTKDKEQEVLTV